MTTTTPQVGARIEAVDVSAYQNPPFSAHCAPAISAHVCCAMETVVHIEYFFDHYRIEGLLFEGTLDPEGLLTPDRSRPGLGLELKRADASRYQV